MDGAVHLHRGASTLMVLLPGAQMRPQEIEEAGLFDAVRQRGLALDLLVMDLRHEAACGHSALDRLENGVLAPARERYQRVWLGGISLGGLLALCHQAEGAGRVDGLCLLSPYPGSRITTNTIARAGGLDAWQPSDEQLDDPEFRAWRWLKKPGIDVPVFFGYGLQDRFADGMRQMAERLPGGATCTPDGGHDWPLWRTLWADFLDRGHFPA